MRLVSVATSDQEISDKVAALVQRIRNQGVRFYNRYDHHTLSSKCTQMRMNKCDQLKDFHILVTTLVQENYRDVSIISATFTICYLFPEVFCYLDSIIHLHFEHGC